MHSMYHQNYFNCKKFHCEQFVGTEVDFYVLVPNYYYIHCIYSLFQSRLVLSGVMVGELSESVQDVMIEATRSYYQHFKPVKKQ